MSIADDRQQLRVLALNVLSNCLTEHELDLVSAQSQALTEYLQKAQPLTDLWIEFVQSPHADDARSSASLQRSGVMQAKWMSLHIWSWRISICLPPWMRCSR
jgi:hypothetical protein